MSKLHHRNALPQAGNTHASLPDPARITGLAAGQAEALSRFDGAELALDRLKKLSVSDAKSLSAFEGTLQLNGLKALDDATAKALAGHSGSLILDGLASIEDTAALFLVPHRGPISLAGVNTPGAIIWSIFLKRGHSPFNQLPPLEAFSIPISDSVKPAYNILHQAILRAITPEEFKEDLRKIAAHASEQAPKRSEKPTKPGKTSSLFDGFLAQPLVSLPFDRMHVPEFLKALKLDLAELETLARGRTPCQTLVALRQYTRLDIPWPTEYFNAIDLENSPKLAEIVNARELAGPSTPGTNLKLWNCHQ